MLFFKIPAALGACLPGKGGESLGPSQGECVRTGVAQAHRRCVGERAGLLWIRKEQPSETGPAAPGRSACRSQPATSTSGQSNLHRG